MQSKLNHLKFDDKTPRKDGASTSPGHFMVVTLMVVFTAEAFVMLILSQFRPLNIYKEALADSVLLSAVIFPSLYILLFRPLRILVIAYRQALLEVKTLRGLLSICMKCKKILLPEGDEYDQDSWQPIERYIEDHSETSFSHGLCPQCYKAWRKEMGLEEVETQT